MLIAHWFYPKLSGHSLAGWWLDNPESNEPSLIRAVSTEKLNLSEILTQAASKLILKLGLQILFSFPFAFETIKVPKRRLLTGRDIAVW